MSWSTKARPTPPRDFAAPGLFRIQAVPNSALTWVALMRCPGRMGKVADRRRKPHWRSSRMLKLRRAAPPLPPERCSGSAHWWHPRSRGSTRRPRRHRRRRPSAMPATATAAIRSPSWSASTATAAIRQLVQRRQPGRRRDSDHRPPRRRSEPGRQQRAVGRCRGPALTAGPAPRRADTARSGSRAGPRALHWTAGCRRVGCVWMSSCGVGRTDFAST